MRINLKHRAVCACVVAATLAFTMSDAIAAGRGGAGGPRASAAAHGGKPTPGPGVAGAAAHGGKPMPGPGVAGGAALGSRPPVPGGCTAVRGMSR